jgi:hypothetical protein
MDGTAQRASRRVMALPGVRQPAPQLLDPPGPDQENRPPLPETDHPPGSSGAGDAAPSGSTPSTSTNTRTDTSSGGDRKVDPKAIAKPVAGILGMIASGVGLLVAWQLRRKLRRPTAEHLDDVAEPLARILARHVSADWLHVDLLDAVEVGNALRGYIDAGPLTEDLHPDAGVPADLQESK